MTTYSTDSFDRTNSTTTLGSTDGSGTVDPIAWVPLASTWGISSNQAYTPTSTVGASTSIDLGQADVVLSVTVAVVAGACGLVFRQSDGVNFWRLSMTVSGTSLIKQVASSDTTVGAQVAGAANGDVLSVVLSGSSILTYRNGILLHSATDSFNSTATKHGLRISSSAAVRLDDWSAGTTFTYGQPVTVTQVQTLTATRVNALSKTLTVTQTQVPTLVAASSINPQTVSATQAQVPSLTLAKSFVATVVATQTQIPTITRNNTVGVTLTATQVQV